MCAKQKPGFSFRPTFFSLSRFSCPFPFLVYFLVLFALFFCYRSFFFHVSLFSCMFLCCFFRFVYSIVFFFSFSVSVFFAFFYLFIFHCFFIVFVRIVLSLFIFFLFRSFFMFLFLFLLSIFVLGFSPFYTTLGKLATSCYAHYLLHSCAPCSLICFLFYMTCDVGRHIANYRATDIEATNWNKIYIYLYSVQYQTIEYVINVIMCIKLHTW